jgi:hypothetical protein
VKNTTNARANAYLNTPTNATTSQPSIRERTGVSDPSSSITEPASQSSSLIPNSSLNQTPVQTSMAATNAKVASFKVPRSWESNAPKFTTEDPDDLLDFVDQVGEIIELADLKTDEEKKKLLTSYLPVRKRTLWRDLDNYANLTYDEFLKEVYKRYPEVKEEQEGTMEDLEKLCRKHQGIRLQDEGKLKRFGAEFDALYKKLSKKPAIILNKEACLKYLDTLDTSFATILRSSISARNLLKADINKAAGVQPPAAGANAVDHRKEDPILLKDLLDMAEQLATTGVAGTAWDGTDIPDKKKSSMFPSVKIEHRNERLEDLSEEVAGIRDSIMVIQKEAKASQAETRSAQAELLKAFQTHLKDPPPHRDLPPHRDNNQSQDVVNRFGSDRLYNRNSTNRAANCFYCDGSDHFSRECPVKIGHINKGWVVVEDGVQKLGDGNALPRGRGPTSQRVEEYYAKKPASQNWHSMVDEPYGNEPPDGHEMDAVWDEMRTLRTQLKQITHNKAGNSSAYAGQPQDRQSYRNTPVANQSYGPPGPQGYMGPQTIQPTYYAQAQVPVVQPVKIEDQHLSTEIARVLVNLINANGGSSDQYIVTRGGKETTPSQGF